MGNFLEDEAKWKEEIEIKISYFDLLCLLGNLVLALKHPKNIGPSSIRARQIAKSMATHVYKKFGDYLPTELINEWQKEGFIDQEGDRHVIN